MSIKKPRAKFDKVYTVDSTSGNVDIHEASAASAALNATSNTLFFPSSLQNSNNNGARTPPLHSSNSHDNNTNNFPIYNFGTTTANTASVLKFSPSFSNNGNNNCASGIIHQGVGSPVAIINSLRNNNNNNRNQNNSNNNNNIPIGLAKTSGLRSLPNSHLRLNSNNNNTNHREESPENGIGNNTTNTFHLDSLISFVDSTTGSIALNSLRNELTKNSDTFLSPISWAESLLDRVHHETNRLNLTRPDCISSGTALIVLEVISKKLSSSATSSPYAPLLEKIHKQLEAALFQKKSYDDNTAYFDLYRSSLRTRLMEIRRPQKAVAQAFVRCNLSVKRAVFAAWRGFTRRKNNAFEAAQRRFEWKKRKMARQLLSSHFFAWKHYMGLRCRVLTSDEAKTRLVFRLARYTKQLEAELQSCQQFCSQLISDNQLSFDRISTSMEKWDEFKNWWMVLDDDGNEKPKMIETNKNDENVSSNVLQIEEMDANIKKNGKNKNPPTVKFLLENNNRNNNNDNRDQNSAVVVCYDNKKNENEVAKVDDGNLDHEVNDLMKEDEQLEVIQRALQEAKRLNDQEEAQKEMEENAEAQTKNNNNNNNASSSSPSPPALSLHYLENQLNKIDQTISDQDLQNKNLIQHHHHHPAQQEIRRANALKLAAEKLQKEQETKHLQHNPTYNKELLDWVSSRIQCVSVSLDLSLNKHQFSVVGTTHRTASFAASPAASSPVTVPAVLTGKQICSNFTTDFHGVSGLEKLSRLAVSLGAPKKLLLPGEAAPVWGEGGGGGGEGVEVKNKAEDRNSSLKIEQDNVNESKMPDFARKLEVVCQELNDLVLIHHHRHRTQRDDTEKSKNNKHHNQTNTDNNFTVLLQPSDVTSMKGRKISLFLHGLYQIYKSVPVHVIPQRVSSAEESNDGNYHKKETLKLITVKRNHHDGQDEDDDEDEDPLLLLERHVNSALMKNDTEEDPNFEQESNSGKKKISLNSSKMSAAPPPPTQRERDELTRWYSELAAQDSEEMDAEVIEEEISANVDNHLRQENEKNINHENDDDEDNNLNNKSALMVIGSNLRNVRERRRARARGLGIPTTKEIIERTLKRSQNVLSEEWRSLMTPSSTTSSLQQKNNRNSGRRSQQQQQQDQISTTHDDPSMEGNNNSNGNDKTQMQKSSISSPLPISSTVRQRALLQLRLGEAHKHMVEWVEDAVDAVVVEKELSILTEQNFRRRQNSINNQFSSPSSHLVPKHQYLHNLVKKQVGVNQVTMKKSQDDDEDDDDENESNNNSKNQSYVFENEHISNLEMLESVLKAATGASSSQKQKQLASGSRLPTNHHHNSGEIFAENEEEQERNRRRERTLQLFEVEKMLHNEVKLKNVKLRSAVGVTRDDTIISMRQLMTALYVLKGGKNFVVVV